MKKTNNKHRQKNFKIIVIVASVALFVIAGLSYGSLKKERDNKTAAVSQDQKKTPSGAGRSGTGSSGGVVDNNTDNTTGANASTALPPQAQTSSAIITLTTPTEDNLVTNGSILSGMASVATVQYRFKDADGLDVATGALTVVSSKYSGSIAGLNARTATGTLEVYNYNVNGAEENWVKINIRYK